MSSSLQANATPSLERIKELHESGLYLQAWQLCQQKGELKDWTEPEWQLIGGRLAHNLGSRRLSRLMHRAAWRSNPEDPEIDYFYCMAMLDRWTVLRSWKELTSRADNESTAPDIRAHWLALKAMMLSSLRDFQRADTAITKALQLQPDDSWLHIGQSGILRHQDRNEESLEFARQAFDLRPWYRPAVQCLADGLIQANQDDEAISLLTSANERLESGDIRSQLAALYLERQQYENARELYDDLHEWYPLARYDRKRESWLAARVADAAYYCGDYPAAISPARKVDSPFYTTLADNLESSEFAGRRKVLPVQFVQQHHMTCAPATLSAISGFWQKEVAHLEVAEQICFDGTPAHRERQWAADNGFHAREFRVTSEAAVQLIDAGIPFTLTTVYPGSAHLQAVIGYDTFRESLIVRDPGERHFSEFATVEMLEHFAPNGPRGMALVPAEQAAQLDAIELPDAPLYDLLFQLERALEQHDRSDAHDALEKMLAADSDHLLSLRGRGSLAFYDSSTRELLSVAKRLREKFPEDINNLMFEMSCLLELGRREERLALLKEQIDKPKCDPSFWTRYAAELFDDARNYDQVQYYLDKALKVNPTDVVAFDMLGSIASEQGRQDEALELFRFAACLGDMREGRARSYFAACRLQNKLPEALQFLRDRVDRFGSKSTEPARTLALALDLMEQTHESFEVLREATQKRPDDGDFQLFCSSFHGRFGQFEQAWSYLEKAKGHCHNTAWLRTEALLLSYQAKQPEALDRWRKVAEAEPLDVSAHNSIAMLLADIEGEQAAVDHVQSIVRQFPYAYGLRTLLIERLKEADSPEILKELDAFLKLHPEDAWGLRERAFQLLKERRFDETEATIAQAEAVDPTSPAVGFLRARVATLRNDPTTAREHYEDSLKKDVDYELSIHGLMSLCNSKSQREQSLGFVYTQLRQQVSFGDGLLAWRSLAATCLDSKIVLQRVEDALSERSDLWQAWSAKVRQLSEMQRNKQAMETAEEATRRFPLLPRVWMDRAGVHAALGDIDMEIEYLRQALAINPTWSEVLCQLASAFEKQGDIEKATAEAERAVAVEPRDVESLTFLARLQWKLEHRDQAVATVLRAVELNPRYSTAWSMLSAYSSEMGQQDLAIETARSQTQTRPRDYRAWLTYATCLTERQNTDEALRALDEAIRLHPTDTDAYSQKAIQLTIAAEFDAAIEACRPENLKPRPLELVGREAWVEGERGNVETAVRIMEGVVKEDQDYFWAWQRLADWYDLLKREGPYRKAAEQMTRISPQDPIPRGYLADAALRRGDRKAAKEHFRKAVQLSPAYSFGSSQLLDMQLEDEEYEAALETVALTAPHLPPAWSISERVRIESLRNHKDDAFLHLRQLAVTPAEDSGAIDSAVCSIWLAGWQDEVLLLVEELLELPEAQPGVAFVFVHLCTSLKKWRKASGKLDQLKSSRPELWHEGSMKYMEEAAGEGQNDRLDRFIARYRSDFEKDLDLWACVGRAYNTSRRLHEADAWMSDWQKRTVTGAALLTLANTKWQLQQPEAAVAISQFAISSLPHDSGTGVHFQMTALYHTLFGDLPLAVEAISMVDTANMTGLQAVLYQYVVIVLENISTGTGYSTTNDQLTRLWATMSPEDQQIPIVKYIHKQARIRVASLFGHRLRAWFIRVFQ